MNPKLSCEKYKTNKRKFWSARTSIAETERSRYAMKELEKILKLR